jgi:aspartate aminotransferase
MFSSSNAPFPLSAEGSVILAMAREAAVRRSQGQDIIDLTLGEPDLYPPAHVVAAAGAFASGPLGYSPSNGLKELRSAIRRSAARDFGLNYADSEVAVGCGAKQIIFNLFMATLDRGSEVIIPAPYWPSYPDMVTMLGGLPVIVPFERENGFRLSMRSLRAAITAKTRWFILNAPCNPTGVVYSDHELEGIARVLRENPHVMVLSDEIYVHIHYGKSLPATIATVAPDLKERIFVVNGVSKAYAMTGWRVGWGLGAEGLISRISSIQSQNCTQTSTLSQLAAIAALDGPQDFLADRREIYRERCISALEVLEMSPHLVVMAPEGAFYLFVQLPETLDDKTAAMALMSFGVATVFGSAFGAPGYLRLSFATDLEALRKGCKRLVDGVAHLVEGVR